MGKKEQKVKISCVGMSAVEVTGSSYLIECPTGEKILLECGLYQSNKKYEDYKINNRKFKFNPKELTGVIVSHLHADHMMKAPLLFKRGCDCNVYMTDDSIDFVKPMLLDCVKIMERDAMALSRKLKTKIDTIYEEESAMHMLSKLRGVQYNTKVKISDNVEFEFVSAGHCFGSAQIVLYVKKPSGSIVKIGFSGDLGNTIFEQNFIQDFEPIHKANFFIGETTYNDKQRTVKKTERALDYEKIKNVITQTCIEQKGMVLIPTFAFQRKEHMLFALYETFKDDKSFNIPIIIDSPLGIKVLDCFRENLKGEDSQKLEEVLEWKNVHIIRTVEESQACVADTSPKIICSSSGMLTQGRSIMYLKKILPKSNCCILTCGYSAVGTLAWRIKNFPTQKTITIDTVAYKNRCNIKSLNSFSGHMQYEELMNYYVNLANNGCSIIWLVHGDKNKLQFKEELEKRIAKIGKTTKVVATNHDTVARI